MTGTLTSLLGIDLPIIQAPIGNAATPALAAAVANAGGLGMLALSWASAGQVRRLVEATRAATARPFGANFVLEWPQQARLAMALDAGVKIVATFWGDPAPYVGPVHQAGGVLLHTVGSLDEAAAAVAAGADALVAQGVEAGGHVSGTVPLHQLLGQIRAAWPDVPLIAAGGIANPQDVAAVLAAGAGAAWLGTRFVCSAEADAAEVYQRLIIAASAGDTVMTTAFHRGWPDAPHRVLRNSTWRAWQAGGSRSASASKSGPVPASPATSDIVAHSAHGIPIERYAFALPTRSMTGDLEAMALYAGEGVDRIHDIRPAGELVRWLAGA